MTKLGVWEKISAIFFLCAATSIAASAQTFTAVYSFTGAYGEFPEDFGSLVVDAQGNVYGTTPETSLNQRGDGIVFKVTPSGQETVLHFFGGPDGKYPSSGLIADKKGNLYGTTSDGGANGWGEVFKLTPSGKKWTLTILHSFDKYSGDGASPNEAVTIDAKGNLYGVTPFGGSHKKGTAYKIDPSGNFTLLHTFQGADGEGPLGFVPDPAGNLYGVTGQGGDFSCNAPVGWTGCGVVFRMSPTGNETVLYPFSGKTDGLGPSAPLILDVTGNALYGVTIVGGDLSCPLNPSYGCGVIFKLNATGETVLYTFTGGADGAFPANLVRDSSGNFYGSTSGGGDPSCIASGSGGCGVLWKLDAAGNFSVLYSFTPVNTELYSPGCCGGLVLDGAGDLYGVTTDAGDTSCNAAGCGTVFKLTTPR
jgi:uncharacterized repeat protein (TIGR03803 family)